VSLLTVVFKQTAFRSTKKEEVATV
jgi:hypothetical protein